MKRLNVVYSPAYGLPWPQHVFPTDKYARVFQALPAHLGPDRTRLHVPRAATASELALVHDLAYQQELTALSRDPDAALAQYEIPISPAVIEAVLHHVHGTFLAIECALQDGVAVNLGGGFHHAFAAHGEGFCFYNDIAVGLRMAQRDGLLSRAVIVDCDVHQGNGTAAIFATDASIATYSIHQENLYPIPKQSSDVDVGLRGGTGDGEYLGALRDTLDAFLTRHPADLMVYVAGADPFEHDRLAQLRVTHQGMRQRDALVLEFARRHRLKVAAVLAGGYAADVEDVVRIHLQLCEALLRHAEGAAAADAR